MVASADNCGVYLITCTVNKRRYIGSSCTIQVRWKQHAADLRGQRHHNIHLQRAWDKHGADAFDFGVLEECSEGALLEREQHWMDKERPEFNIARDVTATTRGLALTPAHKAKIGRASKGRAVSSETRIRLSEMMKKRLPISQETRRKIGEANKGRTHTPESKLKMSISRMGRVVSEETRRKISDGNKGKTVGPEGRANMRSAQLRRKQLVESKECQRS